MSTTSACLRDVEAALLRARRSASSAAAELIGLRHERVQELIAAMDELISTAHQLELHTRADELAGNPHAFAEGAR